MIEPVTYLYYRLYKLYSFFSKDRDNPPYQFASLFGVMVWLIINGIAALIGNAFPSDVIIFPSMVFSVVLIMVMSHFEEGIVKRYDKMSKQQKMVGHVIFGVEIIATILSVIILIRTI